MAKKRAPFAGGGAALWLEQGMAAQRRGDLAAAETSYHKVLQKVPRQPDALHLLGVVCIQKGAFDAAVRWIRMAIAAQPDAASYHANLGRALGEQGDAAGSLAALERAVELDPALLPAVYNLGLAHEASGDLIAARDHYRWATEGEAGIPEAAFNLGNLLVAQDRPEDGIAAYRRALELRPGYPRALANLGYALQKLGRLDEAAEVYRAMLENDPSDAEAAHMLSALTGEQRDRADPAYVAKFFDDYAARFESVLLQDLAYDTPQVLARTITRLRPAARSLRVLDLGCGTGLLGRAIRASSGRLVGVDLSEKMLDKAREGGGYDALHQADLVVFLKSEPSLFDVVTAADVLNYLGDLRETFSHVARRLAPGGLFVFSTETAREGSFQLDRTGRFLHTRAYVEHVAEAAALRVVSCEEHTLRMERGVPVRGNLFVLEAASESNV